MAARRQIIRRDSVEKDEDEHRTYSLKKSQSHAEVSFNKVSNEIQITNNNGNRSPRAPSVARSFDTDDGSKSAKSSVTPPKDPKATFNARRQTDALVRESKMQRRLRGFCVRDKLVDEALL